MNNISFDNIRFLGRIYNENNFDGKNGHCVYFNYSCSGFELEYNGSVLDAELVTSDEVFANPKTSAFIAVHLNDSQIPLKIIRLDKKQAVYRLFETENAEQNKISVYKLNEASSAQAGIISLKGDGLANPTKQKQLKIEFIGDSITCGYGNMTEKPEDGFQTCQENAYLAYAAKTARMLDADFNCVSVSGIGIYSSWTGEDKINNKLLMPMVYPYTDYFLDTQKARKLSEWDFNRFSPDIIVINLGTNDKSYINHSPADRVEIFKNLYYNFLEEVRLFNPKAYILCTLGPMSISEGDPVFEAIKNAAYDFAQKKSDSKIFSFILPEVDVEKEGLGGSFHPTVKTHQKVAECLALKLSEILKN